jgi:hypothetical protein
MDEAQQKLHDKLFEKLSETFDANIVGMNLDSSTKAVLSFAAGAIYFAHKDTGNVDLLIESLEMNSQFFTGMLREIVKNAEAQDD